jgi:hypothetical protein
VCVNELLDQVIKIIIIAAQKTVEIFYSVYLWNEVSGQPQISNGVLIKQKMPMNNDKGNVIISLSITP